jgi:hypothetical protein
MAFRGRGIFQGTFFHNVRTAWRILTVRELFLVGFIIGFAHAIGGWEELVARLAMDIEGLRTWAAYTRGGVHYAYFYYHLYKPSEWRGFAYYIFISASLLLVSVILYFSKRGFFDGLSQSIQFRSGLAKGYITASRESVVIFYSLEDSDHEDKSKHTIKHKKSKGKILRVPKARQSPIAPVLMESGVGLSNPESPNPKLKKPQPVGRLSRSSRKGSSKK